MTDRQFFALYLELLDKISAVVSGEQRDAVLLALASVIDLYMHTPQPAAAPVFAPPVSLSEAQLTAICDAFCAFADAALQLQCQPIRSTASHTTRRHSGRKTSNHKKRN